MLILSKIQFYYQKPVFPQSSPNLPHPQIQLQHQAASEPNLDPILTPHSRKKTSPYSLISSKKPIHQNPQPLLNLDESCR